MTVGAIRIDEPSSGTDNPGFAYRNRRFEGYPGSTPIDQIREQTRYEALHPLILDMETGALTGYWKDQGYGFGGDPV